MTPEEQKIFDAMKAENEQLKKNQAEQNSYITKLEAQRNQQPQAKPAANPQTQGIDSVYASFIEDQMRKTRLEEAVTHIKAHISAEEYAAIEEDFIAFLNANMTAKNCTKDFIIDAFNLVYGRAKLLPDHKLNKVGKGSTTPTPTPNTNAATVAAVQSVIASQPPVMTGKDQSAASGTPQPVPPEGVKSTKDAFANLRNTFMGGGGK